MSCFMVSDKHIDYLASAITLYRVDMQTPTHELTQLLAKENARSVWYRYAHNRPEEMCPHADSIETRIPTMDLNVKPVNVLKAVRCYMYQACEHPEWAESKAHRLCEALQAEAISRLPGFQDAAWEII